jgi:hypothetical protein
MCAAHQRDRAALALLAVHQDTPVQGEFEGSRHEVNHWVEVAIKLHRAGRTAAITKLNSGGAGLVTDLRKSFDR